MDFIISKTSNYLSNEPPCKGAIKKLFPVFHVRTVTEEEYNKKFSHVEGLWRSKGFNHTVTEEGYIKRQEPDQEQWCVELNTLEELIDFYNTHGDLIIKSNFASGTPEIEIYDDYRE